MAAGTATSYEGELPADGTASLRDAGSAPYRTRIVVRRPPSFDGTGEAGPRGGVLCMLLGSTVPFTPEQLAARYASADEHLGRYEAATDAAIAAGFALEDDREELLAAADPSGL